VSTIAYARVTRKAETHPLLAAATDDGDTPEQKASELAQRVAALVPSEVLLIWGIVLALAVDKGDDGSITIKDPQLLKWSLVVLGLTSLVIYVLSKAFSGWTNKDYGRMIVPPFAFIAWTLLTGSTALTLWKWFEKVTGGWAWLIGGVIGAIMLALSSGLTPTTTVQQRLQAAQARATRLEREATLPGA
jgi:hypothetical protein